MVRLCKIRIGQYHRAPIKEFEIEIFEINFSEMENLFEISDQDRSTNIKFTRNGGHGCITSIPNRPFIIRLSNTDHKKNRICFNYNEKRVSLSGSSINLYTVYNSGEITYDDDNTLRLEITTVDGNRNSRIIDTN
ncbi:15987_t:CDS:1 [Gigaspora margarita]|uniref:15987_t:CDS:1 n=1 Tax=Gigaspora margarita TaxID=4874 RepID=A0ABN7UHJ6_GIGMA|nr:15987_t:CDS:1 [Gigaspora margarita]